jgi:hypothetical protein
MFYFVYLKPLCLLHCHIAVKDGEIDRVHGTHRGSGEMHMEFCWGKVKEKRQILRLLNLAHKVEASLYPLSVLYNGLLSNAF